jgi:hypothetical protein
VKFLPFTERQIFSISFRSLKSRKKIINFEIFTIDNAIDYSLTPAKDIESGVNNSKKRLGWIVGYPCNRK